MRTALLVAVVATLTPIAPILTAGRDLSWPDVLFALGGGVAAFVTAYQVVGLTAKLILGALVVALTGVGDGLVDGMSAAAIAVTVVIAVATALAAGSAAPSTAGSVAAEQGI
jgi:hypothetical protein